MTFTSFSFYIFLVVLLILYYILPVKFRWYSLLAGSIAFYWLISEKSFVKLVMLMGAASLCWLLTICMKKYENHKKALLILNLLLIAVPLLIIKEAPIVDRIINMENNGWWIIPVGIAFYSMQLIAYVVDVYKGKIEPQKNLLRFILFASFFPQIIQGPIPRYEQLSDQLMEGHRFDEKQFVKGFMLIIWGFFLKLCIADKAGIIVNTVFGNHLAYQGAYVLIAGILYSFQLYADFLACTYLAQGIAKLFGINIIDNFNHPYFSTSIKDFWRRWHISLSTWLKDYIYIPLGGNRKGTVRKYINLLITFAISGIWHGAGLRFLFWGLLHGTYQVVGDLFVPLKEKMRRKIDGEEQKGIFKLLSVIWTFCLVAIAWVIFRADNLRIGLSMLKSIVTTYNPWILADESLLDLGLGWKEWIALGVCLCILGFVSRMQEKGIALSERILEYNIVIRWVIYITAIVFIMIFGTYGYGYDPQSFIYGGF